MIRQFAHLGVHADVLLLLFFGFKSQFYSILLLWPRKEEIAKNVTKINRKNRRQVSNVWAVRLICVSRGTETVCSVFMSVSVIVCVCVCCVLFSIVAMLEHYEIYLWFQGMWKHVSVTTDVITIAYCLVVWSISLITAFTGDVFMWFGESGFGKLPFLGHKIYKHWLACVKCGLFDGEMVLVQQ